MKKLPYKNKSQVKTRPDFYFLDEGNREAAYKFPHRGTRGRRYPFPLYAIGEFRWGEIAGLRIIFPVEVHGDGDAPSLYTQNEDSERGKSQGCV